MMIKKFKIDSELFWRIFDKALNEESSKEDDLLGSYKGNSYKRTIGEKKLHPWTKVMERTYYTMEKNFNVILM